jgi:small-conductance mechanosensitive channel
MLKGGAHRLDQHIVTSVRRPLQLLLGVAAFRVVSSLLVLSVEASEILGRLLSALAVTGLAWLVMRTMRGGTDWLEERASDGSDEYASRGLRTQVAVLYRIASIAVFVVAIAEVLSQFDVARSVGTSLLASAGIVGITMGLAAQKSLGAIIGGIQISIAQPVRIGDTVVVDAEQGVVEEIHLTYAVVRLLDDRRLVTPISRFLEHPFENWTKVGSQLRGYVTIPADFDTPIDEVRKELERLCSRSPHADGRHCRLDVLDVTSDKALLLRATVSAKDAESLWELRCAIRESLVKFLVALDQGKHLPRARAQTVS